MLYAPPFVVCDVETTGLSPSEHRIIEAAYARVLPGQWDQLDIKVYRFALTPEAYSQGSPRAYEVNGYYPDHPDWKGAPVIDSPEAKAAWQEIERDLTDAVLMNQNVAFDAKFLQAEIDRCHAGISGDPPWHDGLWEVMDFSKAHMKKAGQRGWALHKVYELLNGPKLPEHRAEADVLRAIWVTAEGFLQFPKVWENVTFEAEAAKVAVQRWAEKSV